MHVSRGSRQPAGRVRTSEQKAVERHRAGGGLGMQACACVAAHFEVQAGSPVSTAMTCLNARFMVRLVL